MTQKMGYPTLAVSTCFLQGATLTEPDFALLRRHGIAGIEIAPNHVPLALADADYRAALTRLARQGAPPVYSLHTPFRPAHDLSVLNDEVRLGAVARIEEEMELARALGARLVVVHASWDPIAPGERGQRWAQARRSLTRLVEKARGLSLRLALETQKRGYLPDSTADAVEMLDGLDPALIGYCLDANHSNLTDSLPDTVRALGPRIWNIHLSDNDGMDERHWMPFRGVIDWQAFMAALREVHYTGPLTYELAPHPEGEERCLAEVAQTYSRLLALG